MNRTNLLSNRQTPEPETEADPRPRFAIGHVSLPAGDVDAVADFYERLGMRSVARMKGMAILELRGGTHIVVSDRGQPVGRLDLMVDDVDETRALMAEAGADPSEITSGGVHRTFTATDPAGNELVVNSSHVMGPV